LRLLAVIDPAKKKAVPACAKADTASICKNELTADSL
jgi:hypothetical protein